MIQNFNLPHCLACTLIKMPDLLMLSLTWPSGSDYMQTVKGGAYPRPRTVARVVTTLQLFAAETCNKFLKIEHRDSIVYSKHELILTFLAGATSDLTAGNTTQERLDQPARFLQQILLLSYFTM